MTNHTGEDIRIDSDTDLTYGAKARSQNAVQTLPKTAFNPDFPIILPRNERMYFALELNMSYKEAEKDGATLEDRRKFRKEVEQYFRSKYENVDGFEIRLEDKKIAIDLPADWNKPKN